MPTSKAWGAKPRISGEVLLAAIEDDLEALTWKGKGHHKDWARIRVCRGIRESGKRTHRGCARTTRSISVAAAAATPVKVRSLSRPPTSCGADGVRVFAVDDGWGWIFNAIKHWDVECVGRHVCS